MCFTGFYRVLPCFIAFYWVSRGFYRVLLGSTGFYVVFLVSYWVLPNFTWFYQVLPSFIGFYWVLRGFYWVLLGFTGFYWVLLGFTAPWSCLSLKGRPCPRQLLRIVHSSSFYWPVGQWSGFVRPFARGPWFFFSSYGFFCPFSSSSSSSYFCFGFVS